MAPRKNLHHNEACRDKIQTSQLINRLQNNALGKLNSPLTREQIRCIEILLRKKLPDLVNVEHSGDVDTHHHMISDKPMSNDEWERRYCGDGVGSPAGTTAKPH